MSYSKIDPSSNDTATSSLDLFKSPESKTSTLDGRSRQITPTTDPNSPHLDFEFRTPNFEYLDPEQTRLLVQLHVEKLDGGDIGDEDTAKVIPTTFLLHTLFQVVALSINNNDVSYEANYPHTAYLETLLSRSKGYKETIAKERGLVRRRTRSAGRERSGHGQCRCHQGKKKTHFEQQKNRTLRSTPHPFLQSRSLPTFRHDGQTQPYARITQTRSSHHG